jgi:tetratricopeptide (TPR) repeat protein
MKARSGWPKGLHYLLALFVCGTTTSFAQSPDVDSWVRVSQTYAMNKQPAEALDAIERAFELAPGSVDILRARATLATWNGNYGRARESYERLLKLLPGDHEAILNLARVASWAGKTDAAVDAYTRYVRLEPDAADAWIELARTEGWRGNYSAALRGLDQYESRFGSDERHAREKAAVLARAGRPDEALDILEPLLREHPDDYDLNVTRTVVLTALQRRREAAASLATIRRLQPDTPETHSAERLYRTALAPVADPAMNVYSDSSTLTIQRVAPRAATTFAGGTTLAAGSQHDWLAARQGSGLEQINGTENARHDEVWIGAAQQFGRIAVRAQIGQARTAVRDLTVYQVGADLRPADGLLLVLERDAGFFVVSPRTIGLGISQVGHRASLEWSPAIRWQVSADIREQTLSDGNHRQEFTVSPRYGLARTGLVNLDLGVTVSQLRTATNYDYGYYDPALSEFYAVTAFPYFKVRESVGVGASLAMGVQRDDFSPSFRPGGHAAIEAMFGIYSSWALKVTAAGTLNQRLGSGAFRGHTTGVTLIKRF